MIIDITNTCLSGCVHCMQNSTPKSQHMGFLTFRRSLAIAKKCNAHVVSICGGEPTCHPNWAEYVDQTCKKFPIVVVATNGMWIGSDEEQKMIRLLKDNPQLTLQITSVKGLYPHHNDVMRKIDLFKRALKELGIKRRVSVCNEIESMMALGRACKNVLCLKAVAENEHATTSCFSASLIGSQMPLEEVTPFMEERGKFCRPVIDWKGRMHWSESWLCPSFASVWLPFRMIRRRALSWRPCGKCAGYEKLLAKTETSYVKARNMLGIKSESKR